MTWIIQNTGEKLVHFEMHIEPGGCL
jgi:hypothetical protein